MSVGSPSSNILVTANTIRYSGTSVDRLIELKNTNPDYELVIDHYLLDQWVRVLKTVDLDKAFAEGREYVVEMALEARKWYNDTSIDVTSGKMNKDKINGTPDIKTYDIVSKLAHNTYYEIDDLMVKFGYINGDRDHPDLPIQIALEQGNDNRIRFIINNGGNVNNAKEQVLDAFGKLDKSNGSIRTMKAIVDKLNDLEIKDSEGTTILMKRATKDDFVMVKYIVEKGANVRAVDKYGNDALRLSDEFADILQYLINKGANLNLVNNRGTRTFVDMMIKIILNRIKPRGLLTRKHVLEEMLDNGANLATMDFGITLGPGIREELGNVIMFTDSDQFLTPIIEAMNKQNLFLLDDENPNHHTALAIAYTKGQESKIKLLLDNGASPSTAFSILAPNATQSPVGVRYVPRIVAEFTKLTELIQSYKQFDEEEQIPEEWEVENR